MIPSCLETFGLDSPFEGLFAFEQVDAYMTQDGKIFRGMIFSYTAVVFPEGYIQAPVQTVFNAPVVSDGFGNSRGMVFKTGYEVGIFSIHFSVDISLPGNHDDGF